MKRIIAVESAHRFGDNILNTALIKAIAEKYGHKIGVATQLRYADAFYNLPFIGEIVHIDSMGDGDAKLKAFGYKEVIQIAQNIKFWQYKNEDVEHSLIDTPLWVGRELGLPDFDQKPIFVPIESEKEVGMSLPNAAAWTTASGMVRKTIAIESVYTSEQSWAKPEDFQKIVDFCYNNHRILWVSNSGAPSRHNVNNMLRHTRREIIMCLQHCETFYTTGSGFMCAAFALPPELQPKKIVCLWRENDIYRYPKRLDELKWANIEWIYNSEQLDKHLNEKFTA